MVSGDFNGDGKDDIAAFYDYGGEVIAIHVWLSTDSGFVYQGNGGWFATGGYYASLITGRVVSGDYDEDGNSDIAAFYNYGNGTIVIHVWLSTGSNFTYQGNDGWYRIII